MNTEKKLGRPIKHHITEELVRKIKKLYENEGLNAIQIFKKLNKTVKYDIINKIIREYNLVMKVPNGFKNVIEDYFVNKNGEMFKIGRGRLSLNTRDDGRYVSCVFNLKGCKNFSKDLHRVVYETFKGDVPKGYVVHHIDDNPKNNKLSNLKVITHKENIMIGMNKTDRSKWSKRLTNNEKTTIKGMYALGMTYIEIAKKMGVSRITVENVINNYQRCKKYNDNRLRKIKESKNV